MVYKKYIKRNGKTYGPYVYHSKRINGKVVSEYRGPEESKINKNTKKFWTFFVASLLIISLGAFVLISNSSPTGNVVFSVAGSLENGNLSNGKLNLVLSEGELIPADSVISIENNGTTQTYSLKDLVTNEQTYSGDFNLRDSQISGSGTGYGLEGTKTEFPLVTFNLKLVPTNETTVSSNTTQGTSSSETTNTQNSTTTQNETSSTNNESTTNQSVTNETTSNPSQTNETSVNVTAPVNNSSGNTNTQKTNSTPTTQENTTTKNTPSQTTQNTNSTTTQPAPTETSTTTTPSTETSATPLETTQPTPTETATKNPTPTTENPSTTTQTETPSTTPAPTTPPETTATTPPETTQTTTPSAPITGNVVTGLLGTVSNFFAGLVTGRVIESPTNITGQVSKDKTFTYNSNGEKVELIPGSVQSNGNPLPDNTISIEQNGNEVTVNTNYAITTKGFGTDYTGTNSKTISIDLSKINQTLKEGNLVVSVLYKNNQILSFKENLTNETINSPLKIITNWSEILFNQSSSINNSKNGLESINFPMNLTQEEKNLIIFKLNDTTLTTSVNLYKDRYLVDFAFAGYTTEHTYPSTLSEEELKTNIERDKYLWVKDILSSLSQESSTKKELANFTINSSIF